MKLWQAIIGMVGILILVCASVVANWLPPGGLPFIENGTIIREPDGSLSINSDPSGANVYLDGQYQGTTPLTISGVPRRLGVDYHKIALTMPGYTTYVTYVLISKGKTSTVSTTLIPIPAQILSSGYVDSNSKYLPTPSSSIYPSGPVDYLERNRMIRVLRILFDMMRF